jgi:hypothetical protein
VHKVLQVRKEGQEDKALKVPQVELQVPQDQKDQQEQQDQEV